MTDELYFKAMIGILLVFVLLVVFNMWRARRVPSDNSRIADQNLEMLKTQQENIRLQARQAEALERIAARLDEKG